MQEDGVKQAMLVVASALESSQTISEEWMRGGGRASIPKVKFSRERLASVQRHLGIMDRPPNPQTPNPKTPKPLNP